MQWLRVRLISLLTNDEHILRAGSYNTSPFVLMFPLALATVVVAIAAVLMTMAAISVVGVFAVVFTVAVSTAATNLLAPAVLGRG